MFSFALMINVKKYYNAIPKGSLIENQYDKPDYCDYYKVELPNEQIVKPSELMKMYIKSWPIWFKFLILIRDVCALVVGLKISLNKNLKKEFLNFNGNIGEKISLFKVLKSSEKELLTGADDKHLDFRHSFIIETLNKKTTMIIATSLVYNNRLGIAYFKFVRPIHKKLISNSLRKVAIILNEKSNK